MNQVLMNENLIERKKRRTAFAVLELKKYQFVLAIGLLIYIASIIATVSYLVINGLSDSIQIRMCVKPLIILILWTLQFSYFKSIYMILAAVAGLNALLLLVAFRIDYFSIATLSGYLLITYGALIIWTKMKDPIFAHVKRKL